MAELDDDRAVRRRGRADERQRRERCRGHNEFTHVSSRVLGGERTLHRPHLKSCRTNTEKNGRIPLPL